MCWKWERERGWHDFPFPIFCKKSVKFWLEKTMPNFCQKYQEGGDAISLYSQLGEHFALVLQLCDQVNLKTVVGEE